MREGRGNCLKYLKRGWNRKEGRGHRDFKKGDKLGQRGVELPDELRFNFDLR